MNKLFADRVALHTLLLISECPAVSGFSLFNAKKDSSDALINQIFSAFGWSLVLPLDRSVEVSIIPGFFFVTC